MSSIHIVVVGDTHGVKQDIWKACREAGDRRIQHVVVVGDFGLWTHFADGHEFLDEAQEAARANNLSIYAIGGNHENWDHWNWFVENMPTSKGFAMVRQRVLLAPKVHEWRWAGKQFVAAGGAVSIDKRERLINEFGGEGNMIYGVVGPRGTGPRTLYWDNEELTDQDVIKIQKMGKKADYLFTHDCSNYTPFRGRLKPDPDSERHRRRIDEVLRATKPEVHMHGHMHTKYDWINGMSYGASAFASEDTATHQTQTYGLECNSDWNAWGILNVDTGEFAFRGKGMEFRSLKNS